MATVEVNVVNAGIEIKDNRGNQITLTKDAWESLCACDVQLSKALSDDVEIKFDLDENIKAHTSKFNGKIYVHIRSWWKGFPTKKGVCLLKENWRDLSQHLTPTPDMMLGVDVLRKIIRNKVNFKSL